MFNGHITICKVYSDGRTEKVLDKSNLITAGLGSSFLDIQQGGGSAYTADYHPYYFQVGSGAIGYDVYEEGVTPARQASATFYQLSAPLEWSAYGEDTDITLVQRYRGFNASVSPDVGGGKVYHELLNTSASLSAVKFSGIESSSTFFGMVKEGQVTKFFLNSFEAEIVLDEKSCNGVTISELGLFSKNPKGFYQDSPLLMAYRSFQGISKTKDFSIVVHWNIGFLGEVPNVDDYYTGQPSPSPILLSNSQSGRQY